MKAIFRFSLIVLFYSYFPLSNHAQDIDQVYKKEVVEKLTTLINDFYVLPDLGTKTTKHLMQSFEAGDFDSVKNEEEFADLLTSTVQSVNKDKHMRIYVQPPYEAPVNSPERKIEEQLYELGKTRARNNGLNTVEVLEGNVGYLDLRSFAPPFEGKDHADAYMKLLSNVDALIIDLSKNGGGSPDMVKYLCSYFFEGNVHLNSLYFREGDRTIDFFTDEAVDGQKMIDLPLFVLVSEKTFSGAEEFAYNMQTQKRAEVIGQTTGGGANPGRHMPINEKMGVFLPMGMAINPITKTNWEGVGVVPSIKTEEAKTLEKALEMAQKAAEEYRNSKNDAFTKMYLAMDSLLQADHKSPSYREAAIASIETCSKANLLQEWQINLLGYDYLMQYQKPEVANIIFEANMQLHPNSANVYDSYAESLLALGDVEQSVVHYLKAVAIAEENGLPENEIDLFKANLEKAKAALIEHRQK
jgi:tetratricopeptide (TPR) repeat protein